MLSAVLLDANLCLKHRFQSLLPQLSDNKESRVSSQLKQAFWSGASIGMNKQGPLNFQIHLGSFLGTGQVEFPGPDAWETSNLALGLHENKINEVDLKSWRHPSVPYLQTALVPSELYLIFSFTEKWGDIRMTYVPKRRLPTIIPPPSPPQSLLCDRMPSITLSGGVPVRRRWSQPSVTDSSEQFNFLLFPMRRIL